MKTFFYLALIAMAVAGCSSAPTQNTSEFAIKLDAVLTEVNDAIQVAWQSEEPNSPVVSSVELDLQLQTQSDLSAAGPTIFLAPEAKSNETRAHRLVFKFSPRLATEPASQLAKDSKLAEALILIRRSVAQADSKFKFVEGSMQIQCSFANTKGISGSGPRLVPLQIGADMGKQFIQTLTFNFAPSQARAQTQNSKDTPGL